MTEDIQPRERRISNRIVSETCTDVTVRAREEAKSRAVFRESPVMIRAPHHVPAEKKVSVVPLFDQHRHLRRDRPAVNRADQNCKRMLPDEIKHATESRSLK